MAKKYLTLEEAAEASGLSMDEVKRLREEGELRGFADRGAWKFREEDVEELRRSRQADSSPDVPLLDDEDLETKSVLDSDAELVSEQPTEIHKSDSGLSLGESDSDVRLIMDDSMIAGEGDSNPDVQVGESDSDVRLVGESGSKKDSDSDVKLVDTDSDSDVRLATDEEDDDSDSDVKLIAEGSDSDVKLLTGDDDRSDSDVAVVASGDSGLLAGLSDTEEDQSLMSSDSGVSLEKAKDSGIGLAGDDSGITLEDLADSGISLSDDNSFDLASADESGISLELDEDEGEPGGGTVPMLEVPSLDEEDIDETQLEIPSLEDEESDFDLVMDDDSNKSDADAILFEDEGAGGSTGGGGDDFDSLAESVDVFGEDDDFGGELQTLEADVVESEEDLDVFDAEDEDFEDSFATGESHPGFVPSAKAPVGRVAAQVEAEWGLPTFIGMILSTALLALCCMVMFDLVRSIWGWNQPTASSFLLDLLSF